MKSTLLTVGGGTLIMKKTLLGFNDINDEDNNYTIFITAFVVVREYNDIGYNCIKLIITMIAIGWH